MKVTIKNLEKRILELESKARYKDASTQTEISSKEKRLSRITKRIKDVFKKSK